MYVYDYWMKDGSRKQFLTDNHSFIPDEVYDFIDSHEKEITGAFCDGFYMDVESFLNGDKLKDYQVICKYYEEGD